MPAATTPLTGDELLAAVTDEMVALHKRYHHRAPVRRFRWRPRSHVAVAAVRELSSGARITVG